MIYEVNSPLFRSFLREGGGKSGFSKEAGPKQQKPKNLNPRDLIE